MAASPAISAMVAGDDRPALPAGGGWSAPGVMLAGGDGGAVMLDGDIVVVADARLDNRAGLAAQLGTPAGLPAAAVIAAAYRRWGRDCAARLEGAYAFALWDARARRLVCARDVAGVRPLVYRIEGRALHVAQSAGALREAGAALRSEAISDFLYGRVLDAGGTWFADVERLPAGHTLVFESGALRIHRHAALAPAAPEHGEPPPQTLRTLLDAAVARRAGDGEQVGVLLSGGLDSSSIACLLRDRRRAAGAPPLPVYSMMFREPARSNERAHLDAVLATGGFAPTVLELDGYAPFGGFESLLAATDGPVLAPNLACMRQVVAAAADRGISVLLDGHGGDEVVSHGYGLLDELAARGRWLALLREARGAADNYGRSRWVLTRRVALRQHGRIDAAVIARLLAPLERESATAAGRAPRHILSRDLIETARLRERLAAFAAPEAAGGEAAQHAAVLADPLQPYGFEVHAAIYGAMGVAARYPFWDRQVVQFCLGLPAREKLSRGWSRLVLRRAMAGVVPDSILQRRDKIDFTVHLARGMVRHHHDRISALLASPASPLAPYVDTGKAAALYAAIAADPDVAEGRAVQMIWRAAALGIWLESGCPTSAPAAAAPAPPLEVPA